MPEALVVIILIAGVLGIAYEVFFIEDGDSSYPTKMKHPPAKKSERKKPNGSVSFVSERR